MYPHVFVYLHDIIIVTRTYDEHLVWLRRVLQKIRDAGLVINREKSEFCLSQVKYLGFLVNQSGLQVDPEQTSAIVDYPAPQTMKQLRRFLGMASWYRRFIPTFVSIAEPLTRLTKKSQLWQWSTEQQDAFELLKTHLTAAPTLACSDFNQPFVLQTDASTVGLGAVLTQVQGGEERVIAYASRALTDPEKNYTTTEQECLAVIWAIRKFRS
uniref:RNA-directed DNA polymerase n=1 Tax=Bracon brevicornis TaxID=1563983 RepID=A0A6V7JGH6_9HYME